jgi:two-component system chemotaxis response regulator CheB
MEKITKFYTVAIGLSAGGHQPLWEFFSQIPPVSGAAFIVIPHLNRDFVSQIDQILTKHTAMPVSWATDQERIKPNCVYLIPPNKLITLKGGRLQLQTRKVEDRANWAIDIFFHSLASEEKTHAIGIVLSGVGSDGALGAVHIQDEGGMVLVQDPHTAEFASMPRSVIYYDSPEVISSPKQLAQALMQYLASKTIRNKPTEY